MNHTDIYQIYCQDIELELDVLTELFVKVYGYMILV